jgi:hypothetical protein
MKEESTASKFAAFVAVVALAIWLGYASGSMYAERNIAHEAVANGHAEFRVDNKGSVSFHWKERCP